MNDLRMHEALRIAEMEIGRLRQERAEQQTTIAALRGIRLGLEGRIREQEADAMAGDEDAVEIQNKLYELGCALNVARDQLGKALLENAMLRAQLNPKPERLGDCYRVAEGPVRMLGNLPWKGRREDGI